MKPIKIINPSNMSAEGQNTGEKHEQVEGKSSKKLWKTEAKLYPNIVVTAGKTLPVFGSFKLFRDGIGQGLIKEYILTAWQWVPSYSKAVKDGVKWILDDFAQRKEIEPNDKHVEGFCIPDGKSSLDIMQTEIPHRDQDFLVMVFYKMSPTETFAAKIYVEDTDEEMVRRYLGAFKNSMLKRIFHSLE